MIKIETPVTSSCGGKVFPDDLKPVKLTIGGLNIGMYDMDVPEDMDTSEIPGLCVHGNHIHLLYKNLNGNTMFVGHPLGDNDDWVVYGEYAVPWLGSPYLMTYDDKQFIIQRSHSNLSVPPVIKRIDLTDMTMSEVMELPSTYHTMDSDYKYPSSFTVATNYEDILILGGYNRKTDNKWGRYSSGGYILDVTTNSIRRIKNFPYGAIERATAVMTDTDIYVIGGWRMASEHRGKVFRYDLETNEWSDVGRDGETFPEVGYHAGATTEMLFGKVYMLGGSNKDGMIRRYDITTNVYEDSFSGLGLVGTTFDVSCKLRGIIYVYDENDKKIKKIIPEKLVEIRYTLDGSPVTQESTLYTKPIKLSGSVKLRAAGFARTE